MVKIGQEDLISPTNTFVSTLWVERFNARARLMVTLLRMWDLISKKVLRISLPRDDNEDLVYLRMSGSSKALSNFAKRTIVLMYLHDSIFFLSRWIYCFLLIILATRVIYLFGIITSNRLTLHSDTSWAMLTMLCQTRRYTNRQKHIQTLFAGFPELPRRDSLHTESYRCLQLRHRDTRKTNNRHETIGAVRAVANRTERERPRWMNCALPKHPKPISVNINDTTETYH